MSNTTTTVQDFIAAHNDETKARSRPSDSEGVLSSMSAPGLLKKSGEALLWGGPPWRQHRRWSMRLTQY